MASWAAAAERDGEVRDGSLLDGNDRDGEVRDDSIRRSTPLRAAGRGASAGRGRRVWPDAIAGEEAGGKFSLRRSAICSFRDVPA